MTGTWKDMNAIAVAKTKGNESTQWEKNEMTVHFVMDTETDSILILFFGGLSLQTQ